MSTYSTAVKMSVLFDVTGGKVAVGGKYLQTSNPILSFCLHDSLWLDYILFHKTKMITMIYNIYFILLIYIEVTEISLKTNTDP